MPGRRIKDLTALSGAGSANNDDVVIFDTNANETKRISRSQLAEGMTPDLPLQYYLGVLNSNPTQRLNGNALMLGDYYLDAVTKYTTIYNGSGWNSYASVIAVQTASEAARDAAIVAKDAAQLAETNAETAETNAELAEVNAETARDAALAAQVAAELAETNAETAQIAAQSAAQYAEAQNSFSTIALGIAGTTNGKYFGVKQPFGDAIDIYLNSAGTAVYQQTRPFGIGSLYEAAQVAERNILAYPAYTYTPVLDFHGIDQYANNNNSIWNRPRGALSSNIFPQNTGIIPNVTTQNYALGPSGLQTACRVQIVNNYVQIRNVAFPAGVNYSCRIKVKSNVGAGTLNFQIGQFTASMITVTCDETAWVTVSWTAVGGTSFPIFIDSRSGSTTTIDILVDEIQVYEGAPTLPAFSSEPRETSVYSYQGGNPLKSANLSGRSGAVIDTTTKGYGSVFLPAFPALTTFTEGTLIACFSTTDTAVIAAKILSSDGGEGEWDIGINVGNAYGRPALPRNSTLPGLRVANQGYQIIASRFKAAEQSFFFRKIKIATNANTLTVTRRTFGFCDDPLAALFPFKGKITVAMMFDKWLSDTQIRALVDNMANRHALSGEAPLQPYNFWLSEGDSITEQSGGGAGPYPTQFFATPRSKWFGRNIAVSGSNHVQALTRLPYVVDASRQVAADGGRPIVSYFHGANGIPTQAQIVDYGTQVRAAGAKFIMCTILPKGSDATWETNRLAYNTMLRNNPSWYDALADFGASSTIGAFGAPTARTYYYDDVHLNAAGHTQALAIIQPLLLPLGL